jgi:hypothetical protein
MNREVSADVNIALTRNLPIPAMFLLLSALLTAEELPKSCPAEYTSTVGVEKCRRCVMSKGLRISGKVKRLLVASIVGLSTVVVGASSSPIPTASALNVQWTDRGNLLTGSAAGLRVFPMDVAIGGGKVVIVGNESTFNMSWEPAGNNVWSSPVDPLSFTGAKLSSDVIFSDVEFGNGVFLAIGNNPNTQAPVAFTSLDGVTWTNRTGALPSGVRFNMFHEIRFVGNEFIVSGNFETTNQNVVSGITRTSNGQTWGTPRFPAQDYNQTPSFPQAGPTLAVNGSTVVLGSGYHLPSSSLSVSTDNGTSWNFGIGSNNAFTLDGSAPQAAPAFPVVGFGNGKFIGLPSNYSAMSTRNVFSSTDGLSWVTHVNALGTAMTPETIEYTGSEFVLVAQEGIATSTNGTTWSQTLSANLSSAISGSDLSYLKNFDFFSGLGVLVGIRTDSTSNNPEPMFITNGRVVNPPSITLSSTSGSANVGSAVGSLYTVTNTGDTGTFTISPSAPAGMSFSSSTGLLAGTPTATQAATTYTITVTNDAGTSSRTFSLTIGAAVATTTTAPVAGGSTPSTTAPTTTVPSAGGTSAAAPTLVTSANQATLTAAAGSAVAVINGRTVAVETIKVSTDASSADIQETAKEIVAEISKLLPAGAKNDIKIVNTSDGAELTNLLVNPDDPSEKLNVPVESVTLVKAGNAAVLISALNQTNLPAEVVSGGVIQVTRGGIVAARAYGLPGSQTGEIVLMSTPRLLKRFTVASDGSYNGQVPLPKDISFGSHTVVMATADAKVSLGIKLVRTRMQFRIKRTIATNIFLNRAGVKKNAGKVTVTSSGRCRASLTRVRMSAKPGACYITVKQTAKGNNPAVFTRYTVQVVKKLIKPKKR